MCGDHVVEATLCFSVLHDNRLCVSELQPDPEEQHSAANVQLSKYYPERTWCQVDGGLPVCELFTTHALIM